MKKTPKDRLLSKINITESECWEWTGSTLRGGYGSIVIGKTHLQTHRLSYMLFKGEIPFGMLVCHTCDNPPCINPDHLFLGTHKTNAEDKVNKNRSTKGEKMSKSKLTRNDVIRIRELIDEKIPRRTIAKMYGVGSTCITYIALKKTWGWL